MANRKIEPEIQEILDLLETVGYAISDDSMVAIVGKIENIDPLMLLNSKVEAVLSRLHNKALKAYEVAVKERKMDQLDAYRDNVDRWNSISEAKMSLLSAYVDKADNENRDD